MKMIRLPFPSLRSRRGLPGPALALIAINACASPEPAPTAPDPDSISPVAAAYLEEVVTLLQRYSVKRREIDWTAFRAQVFAAAGPAQTIGATVPGIRQALALLGDGHSVYIPLRGSVVAVPTKTCAAPTIRRPGAPNVGYVRVRQFAGTPAEATVYAQQLQDSIRVADRDSLVGWIVDLRGNSGGNMYPMIAGIGPILGEGVVGYFLSADSAWTPFSYRDGISAYADTPLHQVSSVYRLKRPNPRVAVLTDGWVASSGEAVAVAFRGRADTRSFGTPTCGLSTGNATYFLSDTSRLVITVSTMADRTQRAYGDAIAPDEAITNPDDAVSRAILWLTFPGAIEP
jgi:carboxyl-terminal processing protease